MRCLPILAQTKPGARFAIQQQPHSGINPSTTKEKRTQGQTSRTTKEARSLVIKQIELARKTLAKKHPVDAYSAFCFRDGYVWSFDGVTGTFLKLPWTTHPFCVDGEKLYKILKACENPVVTSDEENESITIQDGTAEFRIPTFNHHEYPSEVFPKELPQTYKPQEITKTFKTLAKFMDNSEDVLGGICLRRGMAYATNGQMIVRAALAEPTPILMHLCPGFVKQVLAVSKEYGEPTYFSVTANLVTAAWEGGSLVTSRQISKRFPADEVDKMFPPLPLGGEIPVVKLTEEMTAVLKRAAVLGAEEIRFTDGSAIVKTDSGVYQEKLDTVIPNFTGSLKYLQLLVKETDYAAFPQLSEGKALFVSHDFDVILSVLP